jgi:hypothetical protein
VNTLKRGLKVGLETTWTLGKVIFPITLFITILSQTPVMDWLVKVLSPMMGLLGLPGEAAIPLVIGNFSNLYAAIGAILSLDLTVKHVFILAVMLSFSHNVFIESSVAAKVGIKVWVVLTVRFGLAIISAIVISLVWKGGTEPAEYGLVPQQTEAITGFWNIILHGLQQGFFGIVQLAAIVIPLMIFIQIMKDLSFIDHFSKWMSPFTRLLGMEKNTSTTLAAGLIFGLAYGAGVMLQAVKEDGVSKRDLYLVFIFLVGCHAVIEDTLIFAPLGIPIWPLLLIRLGVATLITIIVAPVLNKINWDIKELQGKEDVSVGN